MLLLLPNLNMGATATFPPTTELVFTDILLKPLLVGTTIVKFSIITSSLVNAVKALLKGVLDIRP